MAVKIIELVWNWIINWIIYPQRIVFVNDTLIPGYEFN